MATPRRKATRARILIVDNARRSFDQLRDAFAGEGYECEVALELDTARKILAERLMDVAIVSADAVECDDETLVREFKRAVPPMGVIIFNGTAKKNVQRRLRRLGADSYLSKSSDPNAVVRAVERVLEKRR